MDTITVHAHTFEHTNHFFLTVDPQGPIHLLMAGRGKIIALNAGRTSCENKNLEKLFAIIMVFVL